MFQVWISSSIALSLEQCLQVAVGEESAHVEIAGDRVLNQLTVAFHSEMQPFSPWRIFALGAYFAQISINFSKRS